ncbi:hypothetical protein B9Z55_022957 [Caenorhabditis nigoni]|uniref:Uncharacterized protein n=1 Tax=Caenorhabditis nigoni TaxID=1611254 RepID=A0A2G5SMQ6_9PELO|nr:hypothetical protein B9Z55_022957 [Caenorhabditis nigoni]
MFITEITEAPFRVKSKAFVPDKRCSGWYTTTIVGFTGFNDSLSLETNRSAHKLLTRNIHDFLNIYYRYRVYISDRGILIFSVRQEDVNNIIDDLYCFKLQAPKAKDFECLNIAIENAPYYRDLMDEFGDMIHNYDLKKELNTFHTTQRQRSKINFVAAMVNSILKRVILDYHKREDRDVFIKKVVQELMTNICPCTADCTWKCYQNVWTFADMLEALGARTERQRQEAFGPLYIMNRKVLENRLRRGRGAYLKAVAENIGDYEFQIEWRQLVVNERTDNMPIPDWDVQMGRGLWLSQSTTYANWPIEVVKVGKCGPKSDKPEQTEEEIREEIRKTDEENAAAAAGEKDCKMTDETAENVIDCQEGTSSSLPSNPDPLDCQEGTSSSFLSNVNPNQPSSDKVRFRKTNFKMNFRKP